MLRSLQGALIASPTIYTRDHRCSGHKKHNTQAQKARPTTRHCINPRIIVPRARSASLRENAAITPTYCRGK